MVVTLVLEKPVAFTFSFTLVTQSNSAMRKQDYDRESLGTHDFPAGVTKVTRVIRTVEDEVAESDETFTLHMLRLSLDNDIEFVDIGINGFAAVVTIIDDDDAPVTLSWVPAPVGDSIVVAEEVGTLSLGLRAETEGAVAPRADFQVAVQTEDRGEAKVNEDYAPFSPTYTFSAADFVLTGERYVHMVTKDLVIFNDEITEKTKAFLLRVDASISPLPAHVTGPGDVIIQINDSDVTTLRLVPLEPVEEGEDVVVTLVVDKPVAFEFSIALVAQSDSAFNGEDFDSGSDETHLFPAGVTEVTWVITTVEDKVTEGDETFILILSSRTGDADIEFAGVVFGGTVAVVTIIDDDHAPVIETPPSLRAADYTTDITTLRASDEDGDELSWEITGGADQDLFNLTGDGALSFTKQQSYDAPGDANRDGFYHVTVQVTDSANLVEHALTVELVPGVIVANVNRTTAQVTVNAPGHDGETVWLQYGYSDTWRPNSPYTETVTDDGTAVFPLSGLQAGTVYHVRASLKGPDPLGYDSWQRGEFRTDEPDFNLRLRYGPTSVSATPTGDGGYELRWTDPDQYTPPDTPTRTGFYISRTAQQYRQPTVTFNVNGKNTYSYTDPGPLVGGLTYYYTVWAVNSYGPSYTGTPTIVTPQASEGFPAAPSAPSELRWDRSAQYTQAGQVKLEWDAPEDDSATSYRVTVFRIGDTTPGGGWLERELGTTSSTSFIDYLTLDDFPKEGHGLRSYRVYSVNDSGLRSWPVSYVVPVPPPGWDCATTGPGSGCDRYLTPPP